jgi:uncharacterized cupin superfamily protein
MSEAIAPATTRTPSFYDLRAWAAGAAESARGPGQSWRFGRQTLPLEDSAVSVEAFQLSAGSGSVAAQTADEFLHVLEGELILASAGLTIRLQAGRSAVLPSGTAFEWRCEGPVRAIAMRHADNASGEGLCLIDPILPRAPSNPPLAELLTTPTPACRNLTQFRSADGVFTCGVWDSTPYGRTAILYGHHELMHLLEGEVTFEDADGVRATFAAGDVLLVRRGARCSWDSPVPVTKVFAIYRPG